MKNVARICGIIGGVWVILLSLLMFLSTPTHTTVTAITRDETGQVLTSMAEKSLVEGSLQLLIFSGVTLVMGVLAMVSVMGLKNRPGLRSILIWVSVAGIIVCGTFSMGLFLVPADILLILAAIGIMRAESKPLQGIV